LVLDPSLSLVPDVEARQLVASGLVEEGSELAGAGDLENAIARFREAVTLNPTLGFDPEAKARQLAALALVGQGANLAREGKLEEAIATYAEAQTIDPMLEISADSWNTICWFGSLWGYAADVMYACEKAVEMAPDHGGIRDSRGLARALMGDYADAVEDFKFYVEWSKEPSSNARNAPLREAWIAELERGRSPFDSEVLEALLSE
jgi:tetratricopeptide (TPR) repeat protein